LVRSVGSMSQVALKDSRLMPTRALSTADFSSLDQCWCWSQQMSEPVYGPTAVAHLEYYGHADGVSSVALWIEARPHWLQSRAPSSH
jgi:hypothetical protein